LEANGETVCLRRAGDDYLLVEFGPPQLDLTLRFQVHVLMERLQELAPAGLIDLTPGIRSLQIHVDSRVLPLARLRDVLGEALSALPPVDDIAVPTRIVHLPLSWDDEATRLAIRKYQELVRPDAPWCPSNIEFIRRINGLADEDAVRAVVFDAHYLVLGLGDVYLGAPVATPGGSAPSPGDDEIQSGARGRRRTRSAGALPLHLRDGRPGRVSVRGPHRAGLEHVA
jgi:urea carboxylase